MNIELTHIPDLEIIKTTYLACGVEYNESILGSRKWDLVMAKFISIYLLCQKGTERKLICKLLGYKDHTTIVHALKVIDYRVANDNDYYLALHEAINLLLLRPCKEYINLFNYTTSF